MSEHVIFRWTLLLVLTAATVGIFYNAHAQRYVFSSSAGLVRIDRLTGDVTACRMGSSRIDIVCAPQLTPEQALAKALEDAGK